MLKSAHFVASIGFCLGVAMTARTSTAGAACLVRGNHVSLEGITVQPRGTEAFTVDIQDVPVAIKVAPYAGGPATTEVQGAVRFAARRKNLWLTLAQDFASTDGLVSMRRGSKLVHARLDGDAVIAAAVEYSNDVLSGEDKDAEEFIVPIRVPCSMLTLDNPDDETLEVTRESDEIAAAPSGAIWWEPKTETRRVRLHAKPADGARFVDIENRSCSNCIDLVEVGERGSWLEVQRYGEGVLVRGWIRRSAVRRSPPEVAHGRGYGCSGDHRRGMGGEHRSTVAIYDGPATIQANTRIYARPRHGAWATVVEDSAVRVRYDAGDTWVQLSDVPGVWSGIRGIKWLHAYVPLSAVVIPIGNAER